jgi:hypothetical protein
MFDEEISKTNLNKSDSDEGKMIGMGRWCPRSLGRFGWLGGEIQGSEEFDGRVGLDRTTCVLRTTSG